MPEIRLIEEGDIAAFHAALSAVSCEQKYLSFLEGPPLESTRAFVLENIRSNLPQYVAVENGELTGWCDIIPNTSRPVYRHIGVLGMGVVAHARGRGTGRALITAALGHAKKMNLKRIELEVYASNVRALRLYESMGFKPEGIKRNHAIFPDRTEDSHFMALYFD